MFENLAMASHYCLKYVNSVLHVHFGRHYKENKNTNQKVIRLGKIFLYHKIKMCIQIIHSIKNPSEPNYKKIPRHFIKHQKWNRLITINDA